MKGESGIGVHYNRRILADRKGVVTSHSPDLQFSNEIRADFPSMPFEAPRTGDSDAVKDMKSKLSKLETPTGRLTGLQFNPKPGDVMIVTPPKCGTTLVCQIAQSLRSQGDMSFEEINLVIPCLEMAYDSGYTNLDAPQGHHPRLYKTHAWYRDCPKGPGVKYIYMVRDPIDAAVSFFHFLSGWFFEPGTIRLNEFIREFVLKRGAPSSPMENASLWHNIASWWPRRHDPNVLWLCYEDVVQDLARGVGRIAEFLRLANDDPALQAIAVEQSRLDHMLKYPSKYDEHHLKEARNTACGLAPRAGLDGSGTGKVRKASTGEGKEALDEETLARMQRKWNNVVLPVTGCTSYTELRASINNMKLEAGGV